MVLPAAVPAFADTEKLDPTVGRVPEMLAGAATAPGPVAESESCVIAAPAVFHALATAVSELPACSVARLSGGGIATRTAGMLIAARGTAAAPGAGPALSPVPGAPVVTVKRPSA